MQVSRYREINFFHFFLSSFRKLFSENNITFLGSSPKRSLSTLSKMALSSTNSHDTRVWGVCGWFSVYGVDCRFSWLGICYLVRLWRESTILLQPILINIRVFLFLLFSVEDFPSNTRRCAALTPKPACYGLSIFLHLIYLMLQFYFLKL